LSRWRSWVATGIAADGTREVLGLDVGDSEAETFWRAFLLSLKQRCLTGVRLVISDQLCGLVAAFQRSFQGSAHQRCRVHFARNLLAHVPKTHADDLAVRVVPVRPLGRAAVAAGWSVGDGESWVADPVESDERARRETARALPGSCVLTMTA
jgi:putative transposase